MRFGMFIYLYFAIQLERDIYPYLYTNTHTHTPYFESRRRTCHILVYYVQLIEPIYGSCPIYFPTFTMACIEGLPPMPPTPLLEVLSMFQNQNLLRSILSVQGGSFFFLFSGFRRRRFESFIDSVGDDSRVLLACVLHALGTNPAAVRGFRNRFPKPNFEKERKKIASRPSDIARNNSTIARYARLESRRHHLEIWLWKTVAKASNSSRIRTQGMQNTSQ